MTQLRGRPAIVLSEEAQQASGMDAQSANIEAGRAVAETVRTTLGPRGMDKMLVDVIDIVVTNDGATILREMDVEHPAAETLIDVATSQEEEVGDGTTTATVLAGGLLHQAESLLDRGLHPTTVADGYRRAAAEASDLLDGLAIEVGPDDEEVLRRVATTAMTGKGAEGAKDHLADLLVEAVGAVADEDDVNLDAIKVEKLNGKSLDRSRVIDGLVLDREREHDDMPRVVTDAKVAVIDQNVSVEEPEADVTIEVDDPDDLDAFREGEKERVRETVRKLKEVGADVVIVGMDIDDTGLAVFAEEDVYALRRISTDDTFRIARATGANVVTHVDDLTEEDLGYAGRISEMDHRDDRKTIVEDVPDAKSVTLFLRGGTFHVLDEVERAINDSLGVIEAVLDEGKVVPGGGSPEVALALGLRDFAEGIDGREQLAVEEFAGTLEIVPRTLAENAGHDPIDSLLALRSRHADGDSTAGLDAHTGEIVDMEAAGVLEPLRVKRRAIESAMEAAAMLLRVDDVIPAGDSDDGDDAPDGPGGPPGGPGVPGGPPGGPGAPGGPLG